MPVTHKTNIHNLKQILISYDENIGGVTVVSHHLDFKKRRRHFYKTIGSTTNKLLIEKVFFFFFFSSVTSALF